MGTQEIAIDKAVVLPTIMLALLLIFPTSLGKLKFIPIYKAISIKQNKHLPPHVAYLDSNFESQNSEWIEITRRKNAIVNVGAQYSAPSGPYILTDKRILSGVVIRKSTELLVLGSGAGSDSISAATYKTPSQREEENQGPQWINTVVKRPIELASAEQRAVPIMAAHRITGPLEISGGLAVTNVHHIEVRRSNDGVFQEMGKVDLQRGVYSIDVNESSGLIVARLVNTDGEVLGEGSARISQLTQGSGKLVSGPRLELSPTISWTGQVTRYYPTPRGQVAPSPNVTTFAKQNTVNIAKNGDVSFDSLVRNSSTIVRASTKGHVASNRMLIAGEKGFSLPLFPNSMMSAMKNIVASDSGGVPKEDENGAMVWGTAKVDGRPISGVTVQSESDPSAKAIYFNELMIPDSKLTATSTNGMFAFVNVNEGFQALLAQRGDAYFGHQNVLVEKDTVSVATVDSTLRTEPVTIRAFDAFTGDPVDAEANLQSLQGPVSLAEGTASVILPQVSRLSLLYTENTGTHLKANYFYNDSDSYIHLPMISEEWLVGIRNQDKVNQVIKAGTIVGFVPSEEFEVYLAGTAKAASVAISYFDATGKSTYHGVAGGGFIIFNVPPGMQEAVVVSSKTDKILSKVVPVDEGSLSILSFNSY